MPITIYPGSMKKRNANGSYSDLVPAIATDPEVLDDFAEEYSTSETYNIGDYCIHNSDLYKCNMNNTTGTWNNNAWDRVSVADELLDHKNTLNQFKTDTFGSINLSGTNTTGSPIEPGTCFYNNGVLVKAYRTIGVGAQINLNANAFVVTGGALNTGVVLDYIEPAFTNGIATYDMSTKLAARGLTALDRVICQINSSSASTTAPIIRSCGVSGAQLTIAMNTNTFSTSAIGVFVLYCGH